MSHTYITQKTLVHLHLLLITLCASMYHNPWAVQFSYFQCLVQGCKDKWVSVATNGFLPFPGEVATSDAWNVKECNPLPGNTSGKLYSTRTHATGRDIRRPSCKPLPRTANARQERTWSDTEARLRLCTVVEKEAGTSNSTLRSTFLLFLCHVHPVRFRAFSPADDGALFLIKAHLTRQGDFDRKAACIVV